MDEERTVLSVQIGQIGEARAAIEKLNRDQRLPLSPEPRQWDQSYTTVFLAAGAQGDLYVIAGALWNCKRRVESAQKWLEFDRAECFAIPVPILFGTELHRTDLRGDALGWSANPYNYLLARAHDQIPAEARALEAAAIQAGIRLSR